jgi:Putative MetA-pathway of phenol degradation
MLKLISTFILGFTLLVARGQDINPIVTDRPDQTESPFLVPPKYWQLETGFYEQHIENIPHTHEWILPNVLIKYGLNRRLELRLVMEGSKVVQKNIKNPNFQLNPIDLGFKAQFWEEKGGIPKTSLLVHSTLPPFWDKSAPQHWGTLFRFTMQHTLSKKWNLGYNLGGVWQQNQMNGLYTLSFGHSLSSKLSFYVETYGAFSTQNGIYPKFNAGVTFNPKPNLLFDVSFGKSQFHQMYDFIGIGFSIRLPNPN